MAPERAPVAPGPVPGRPLGDGDDVGRRERKKSRTRENLMAAARRLFAAKGFEETTTEDIAEAADVSQRTFFRYFPSKEAVLYGDMDQLCVRVRRALEQRPPEEGPLVAVREAILALADDHENEREQRLLQARLAATSPAVSAYSRAVVQSAWEKEITEVLAARMGVDPARDPRPEIVTGAAMSALRASLRRWTASGGRADLPGLVTEALDAMRELGEAPTDRGRAAAMAG